MVILVAKPQKQHKIAKMKIFNLCNAAAALVGLVFATHAVAADDSQRFDLVCKAVNQEITGTTTTGGVIKPLDVDDPFYAVTISVDIAALKYCFVTRCDGALSDFASVSGDDYATNDQAVLDSPDDDGDIYAVYQAINPKTNSLRLRVTYYDDGKVDAVGTQTLYSTCTRAPFTNGGL